MTDLLCVRNLTKTFAGCTEPVIRDVSFCVKPGEVFTLLGPSGCGKTTTLRAIMGFEHADRGEVIHNGHVLQCDAGPGRKAVSVPTEKRGIGFVFQDYALFPHLSVIENVMFGVKGGFRAMARKRRRQIAKEALWMVGLMGLEDRRPHDLSGGQQQRVAIARAIAPGNRLILLDEPFSNLDPELRHATRHEVRLLAERGGIGIVLVTHDQEEALSTADQLAVMRDGRIIQQGPPEEVYNRPKCAFIANFLGRTNLLLGTASGRTASTPLGDIALDRDAAGDVTLSLRPEHLEILPPTLAGDAAPAVGTVTARAFKGHDITFKVRFGPAEYLVQTHFDSPFQIGEKVALRTRHPAAVVEPDPEPIPPVDELN